jgi:hypothetical protein
MRVDTNNQPTPKAMKTPISHIPVVMILPGALLLSQCVPAADPQHQLTGTLAPSGLHRVLVSFSPATPDPAGFSASEVLSVRPENEPLPAASGEQAANDPADPNVSRLSPVVVTTTTYFDLIVDDWPANVVDAELMSSRVSFKGSEPPARHATEDSVAEWVRSLR